MTIIRFRMSTPDPVFEKSATKNFQITPDEKYFSLRKKYHSFIHFFFKSRN